MGGTNSSQVWAAEIGATASIAAPPASTAAADSSSRLPRPLIVGGRRLRPSASVSQGRLPNRPPSAAPMLVSSAMAEADSPPVRVVGARSSRPWPSPVMQALPSTAAPSNWASRAPGRRGWNRRCCSQAAASQGAAASTAAHRADSTRLLSAARWAASRPGTAASAIAGPQRRMAPSTKPAGSHSSTALSSRLPKRSPTQASSALAAPTSRPRRQVRSRWRAASARREGLVEGAAGGSAPGRSSSAAAESKAAVDGGSVGGSEDTEHYEQRVQQTNTRRCALPAC